jgi:uncharacterized membrane protein YgaE (UPF0421/DUF939 family)
MLLARSLNLPEFYWAPISTIVVILFVTDPLIVAWLRFAGTALGAFVAALIATWFQPRWIVYGAGIFICGILCALLRIGTAYRFAAITLSIVLLIGPGHAPWTVALHRFIEVSLGIAVALVATKIWRIPAV